jgi:hypothetical protein
MQSANRPLGAQCRRRRVGGGGCNFLRSGAADDVDAGPTACQDGHVPTWPTPSAAAARPRIRRNLWSVPDRTTGLLADCRHRATCRSDGRTDGRTEGRRSRSYISLRGPLSCSRSEGRERTGPVGSPYVCRPADVRYRQTLDESTPD